jgi:type VI protein secretion system component VasK
MNLAFRRFAVYCRLALMGAVVVVLALIIWMNRENRVGFWLFGPHEDVNVLYIILITAIVSVAVFWIVTRVRGVLRELQAVRAEKLRAADEAARQRQANEVAEREKRLDEKLRRSLTERG